MGEQIRVDLCGPLTVTRAGQRFSGRELGSRKARTLLAMLAVAPGTLVPAERIHDALWPSGQPLDPPANLATLVSRLRRLLGDQVVLGNRAGYRLADDQLVTDLGRAAGLVGQALVRADREPALAAAAATHALDALSRGDPVAEEPAADWAEPARRRAAELRRSARHALACAATASGDHETAVRTANVAVEADPFDEQAHRDLMRALAADGRSAAALEVFSELEQRLASELGVDPDETTRELFVSVLRHEQDPGLRPAGARSEPPGRSALLGRDTELRRLEQAWADSTAGRVSLVLVTGEAGIGKTRLLTAVSELAGRTGGRVLAARCHAGESSLFLQPFVDLLRPAILHEPGPRFAELAGPHAQTWATLVPELRESLGAQPAAVGAPDHERRRAYEAVAELLRHWQSEQPLLVMIDDLQDAGAATLDLLGFLTRHLHGARLLLLGAARAEARSVAARLADAGETIDLGPLPADAVTALAGAAGLSEHGARVLARTAGHSLSVVESLRALAEGDTGVPASLAEAIMARVNRLDTEARRGIEAAAVLGVRVQPGVLAEVIGESEIATVHRCDALVEARLLVVRGPGFEFSNDLVQETVLGSLPGPLAAAYHRRAANVLVGQPELMAAHAEAAGEPERAVRGWLLAGENAMRRSAVEDAHALFDRALSASRPAGQGELTARALLARAHAGDALGRYSDAMRDIEESLEISHSSGHTRLEMAAELARGGDVAVALGRPIAECGRHLEAGLGLATLLGDRPAEAEFNARLTVLATSRLELAAAFHRATDSLTRARHSGDEDALVPALDGLMSVHAYFADAEPLTRAARELIPILRRRDDLFLLQWAVFKSSFGPAARGDWSGAQGLIDDALELNQRSGYLAYAAYFRAHRGWLARLAGDLSTALQEGRRSLDESSPIDHPWWYATAAGLYASTLLASGDRDQAATVAELGHGGTAVDRPEAFRLRCLAPLAAATGQEEALTEATRILDQVVAPPDRAWVVGADTYLDTAAAWLAIGEVDSARRVLEPLKRATGARSWQVVREQSELLQNSSSSS